MTPQNLYGFSSRISHSGIISDLTVAILESRMEENDQNIVSTTERSAQSKHGVENHNDTDNQVEETHRVRVAVSGQHDCSNAR